MHELQFRYRPGVCRAETLLRTLIRDVNYCFRREPKRISREIYVWADVWVCLGARVTTTFWIWFGNYADRPARVFAIIAVRLYEDDYYN